jgi:hypothetical protein
MTWNVDQVMNALSTSLPRGTAPSTVSLPLYSDKDSVGIGVDGTGYGVLVLPGLETQTAFEASALRFDPWCSTTRIETAAKLPMAAVLRCNFDASDENLLRLVAGIIIGLVDLHFRFGDAGKAIWALKSLFGDGFTTSTSQTSTIRGLIGELAVLRAARDTKTAVDMWHVNSDNRYDFSQGDERLEVKTTSSTIRQHKFNSRQLPPLKGISVWIASVQVAEVSVGMSISELVSLISKDLPLHLSKKVADIVVETTGLPPASLGQPQFDLNSTVASIKVFRSSTVPTPRMVPGTSNIKWDAILDEAEASDKDALDLILSEAKGRP